MFHIRFYAFTTLQYLFMPFNQPVEFGYFVRYDFPYNFIF